jgi:radical SAM superfamily enzyme YgiQ (UPF0313 family)
MRVVLLSCYELGHQPLSLAWPLAALREAGLETAAFDLSVVGLPAEAATAELVGIAVPMHTALRLGVEAARQVRAINPAAHICFYGLYAWLNRAYLLKGAADSIIAGEYEKAIVEVAQALARGESVAAVAGVTTRSKTAAPALTRLPLPIPVRDGLPGLDQYARYEDEDGRQQLAGYTEASRGCLHTCRHCPVVPVYGGRFFVVPVETVLADVRQQVAAGAQHITFGDPDFLNGPGHALKVTRALHAEFPEVTFDFTTKVEHILEKRALLPELRQLGASFVVSAFESVSDRVLARLDKGHTAADLETALAILAEAELPVQPTWVPFTPWTALADYLALLAWIRQHGLVEQVSAVQLSIRLLVPPGSALLEEGEEERREKSEERLLAQQPTLHAPPSTLHWPGVLDEANFTYQWRHVDPYMDWLQREVVGLAAGVGRDDDPYAVFQAIERLAYGAAGKPVPSWSPPAWRVRPPRLTEDWFC